jgi:BNR repeat-containing family member
MKPILRKGGPSFGRVILKARMSAPGWLGGLGLALLLPLVSLAQTNFTVLADDGAWTWYNDPRAAYHNGVLYFGWVRFGDGKSVLSVFDPQTGHTTNLWESSRSEKDDHNVPAILVKEDGKMLAIYARHTTDNNFAWRLSTDANPVTSADWSDEREIPETDASMTYANPFQLSDEGGRIYDFARNLNFNPTVFVSTNGGESWSPPQLFIKTGTNGRIRPYAKYTSDNKSRIDVLYTDGHPRDVANSLYHLYYQGGAFYKTDGTFLKKFADLPILHDSGERGSVIYHYNDAEQTDPNQWIPHGRAWCWEIASQSNGAPVCVFTVRRANVGGPRRGIDNRIYYYYARWTGTEWQKRFIANAGRPLYAAEDDYAGGICINPENPNEIYISSNAREPFNLTDTTKVPLSGNERYEIWRGVTTDGGLTFQWTPVTTNSTVDNLRPYIPLRYGGPPTVLWFRGTYNAYTHYQCQIVGVFDRAAGTR